jgi:hypothetical protein
MFNNPVPIAQKTLRPCYNDQRGGVAVYSDNKSQLTNFVGKMQAFF